MNHRSVRHGSQAIGGMQTCSAFVGGQFRFDVLNIATGASLIFANKMFLTFKKFSANGVATGVAHLHLSANVRPGEITH